MRDDNDYSSMGRPELRVHLERVLKQRATWAQAAAQARQDECLHYLDGVLNSRAKAVTERKLDGELHAGELKREALEAEGYVAYYAALAELIVTLLRTAPEEAPHA